MIAISAAPAPLPALYVSHGSPMLALSDDPASRFLTQLGRDHARPKAILVASAHWETGIPALTASARPSTIHDFYGFPPALYQLSYPAPGAPQVALAAAKLLEEASFEVGLDPARGLDHGAWVPLRFMAPAADIPVVQLSIQPHLSPAHHYRVGRALRPLRSEGVLILASGSMTHNLREMDRRAGEGAVSPWVDAFTRWFADAAAEGRIKDLLAYRSRAPEAVRNHPEDDHLLPFFVALGAGDGPGRRLHDSVQYRSLAMDAYAF